MDAWGLGCLVHEVFAGARLQRTEELRDLGAVPGAVHKEYQRLLASAAVRRLDPAKLADNPFFDNRLADTIRFLEKLAIKDSAEKVPCCPARRRDAPPGLHHGHRAAGVTRTDAVLGHLAGTGGVF